MRLTITVEIERVCTFDWDGCEFKALNFNQCRIFFLVSRCIPHTQQGRQREPRDLVLRHPVGVKTLCSPLPPNSEIFTRANKLDEK